VASKKILVTGGAGFIGSQFVRDSAKSDDYDQIFVIDKLTYAGNLKRIENEIEDGRVEFIHDDINNSNKYSSIFNELDFVVHFAAESHVDRSIENGLPFLESNVVGTYNLLDTCKSFPLIRIVAVSTDEVYGSIVTGDADEEFKLNPASIYSASKSSSDLIALALNRTFGLNISVTRGCNTFGPFQDSEKLIPLAVNKLLEGLKVPLYGDGSNVREWLYVSDHAAAITKVLQHGISGEVYNIGSNFRISNIELIKVILRLLKLDESNMEFVQDRKGHDYRYALDSTKIREKLNWKPSIPFEEGLKLTLNSILSEKS
jgi:dTDP-glucose 4,6-dehydratase